ncbi:MAG: hypothetical protein A2744_01355 [Candidatus Buchananbacteria bacterium RIFCSPHIGHO2_01_FULL_44_11]|uniref:NAD-dependent epimerase/dehydratase domain-containing protein n=1 Tax=Candidatus Buchananbacteria bacterium RIFCSPHIGHO2_01_FULL_44_11 TaxID=1797535 RepID=A0A1G1XZ27_9BACT|nr:MAG: hypothetical protein A2744_01355 [Candidatus Buchananbacteria bacterium RIFCSPHIGHO2_01_FULL_44_11]
MKILVTGGAGFIGSNLVADLVGVGKIKGQKIEKIVVIDNLFLGRKEFIQPLINQGQVDFFEQDLLDQAATLAVFKKCSFDLVFHLAANSDIAYGAKNTDWDLKQGTLVTFNVLAAMKDSGVKQIIFASTSAVYGEVPVRPISEDYSPMLPISFYGLSKLAAESLISAFCHNFGFQAWVYRFGNIVGFNGTHGVLVDFIKKLKADPKVLPVLGDGRQAKPYLYVADCVAGMIFGYQNSTEQNNCYNLACEGSTPVSEIAQMVIKALGLTEVNIQYAGGDRGWPGDVPQVRLDPAKLAQLGWQASLTSDQAVLKAIQDLIKQI